MDIDIVIPRRGTMSHQVCKWRKLHGVLRFTVYFAFFMFAWDQVWFSNPYHIHVCNLSQVKKTRVVTQSRMYQYMFASSSHFLGQFALWTSLQVSRAYWCGKPSPNARCRGDCNSWKCRREEGRFFDFFFGLPWLTILDSPQALWIRGSYSGPCPCPLSFTCFLSRLFQPQSLSPEAFQFVEDF